MFNVWLRLVGSTPPCIKSDAAPASDSLLLLHEIIVIEVTASFIDFMLLLIKCLTLQSDVAS